MDVIALHGFLGHRSDWDHFKKSIPGLEARDLWADARTLKASEPGLEAWARVFNDSIAGDRKPVLLGYSMGGRLAMQAAVMAPEKFSAAIFVSANPGLKTEEERKARLVSDQAWAAKFRSSAWQELMNEWNAQPVLKAPPAGTARSSIALDRSEAMFDRETLALAMDHWSLGRQADLSARLSKLPFPVLYVSGGLDAKFTDLAGAIPKGPGHKRVAIGGAGHRAPWDQPRIFGFAVEEFLQEHGF